MTLKVHFGWPNKCLFFSSSNTLPVSCYILKKSYEKICFFLQFCLFYTFGYRVSNSDYIVMWTQKLCPETWNLQNYAITKIKLKFISGSTSISNSSSSSSQSANKSGSSTGSGSAPTGSGPGASQGGSSANNSEEFKTNKKRPDSEEFKTNKKRPDSEEFKTNKKRPDSEATHAGSSSGSATGSGNSSKEVKVERAPPRIEPHVEPVNGIVQPAVVPPASRPGRITNQLVYLKNVVLKGRP